MTNIITYQPLNRDPPHGRPQWRFNVFAQDEGGEGLVGFAEVQINLKDVNDNAVSIKSHSFRISSSHFEEKIENKQDDKEHDMKR